MSEKNTKSRELIINLYQARKEKAERKAELVAAAEKFGCCVRCVDGESNWDACFNNDIELSRDEWCEVCTAKQPIWKAYHASCGKAAGALRSLLAHGKKLAEEAGSQG